MSTENPPAGAPSKFDCPDANSGTIFLVLDAPAAKDGETPVSHRFVDFDTTLAPGVWLHFHCRGGDGRTTTFLAMHDIIHNAPQVSVNDILVRQYLLGGVNLYKPPDDSTSYQYPFAVEREKFIRDFYDYVYAVKPGGFKVNWSAWVAHKTHKESEG